MAKEVFERKFYDLMGVPTDVDEQQLRKAYRRRALQLHPDKRGNSKEAQEEFTQMKHAYDVLSDPKRREVYDTMGESGLKLMEEFGSLDPNQMMSLAVEAFLRSGFGTKCCVVSIIMLFFIFILSITIFWCLRVDGTVSWDWSVVFIPLWIVDAVMFCIIGCDNSASNEDEEPLEDEDQEVARKMSNKIQKIAKGFNVLKGILFVLFQIFIVLKLDNKVSWSTMIVIAPYLALEGCIFVQKLISTRVILSTIWKHSQNLDGEEKEKNTSSAYHVIRRSAVALLRCTLRFVQGVLIALRVEKEISCSWWIVFIPVWIMFLLYFVQIGMKYSQDKKVFKAQQEARDAREGGAEDENQEQIPIQPTIGSVISQVIYLVILFSPAFILAERLQSGDFSTFYILLGWYIVIGVIFLLITCAIFCFGNGADDGITEEIGQQRSSPNSDEGVDSAQYNQV